MPTQLLDNAVLENPPVCIPLTGGLIGAPVPATKAAPGLRIANNIRNSPGGRSIERTPGWMRSIPQRLRPLGTYPLDNTSKIVCTAGDPAMGSHGTSFYKIDWTLPDPYARVQALGYCPSLAPAQVGMGWVPASAPVFVLSAAAGIELGRLTAHEYTTPPVAFNNAAYFVDKYSNPMVAQSGIFRQAVPSPPPRKWVLCAAGDFNAPCNVIHPSGEEHLVKIGDNCDVTNNVLHFPTWGPFSQTFNQVEVMATAPNTALCYRNLDFTFRDTGRIHTVRVEDSEGGGNMEKGFWQYRVTYLAPYTKPVEFDGDGINDMTLCECPDSWTEATTVIIRIKTEGTPDHIEWSTDGGMSWTGDEAITGIDQIINLNVNKSVEIVNFTGSGPDDMVIFDPTSYSGAEPADYIVRIATAGNTSGQAKRVEDFAFTGIPTATETITVNNVVFTFVALAVAETEITIGADATTTIDNCVTKINAYTPDIGYTALNVGGTDLTCTSDIFGAGPNSDVFAEAATNVTLSQTTAGANGTEGTAVFNKNGGSFGMPFDLVQTGETAADLDDDISVTWGQTAPHGVGDHWKIHATPGQVLCVHFEETAGHDAGDTWTIETIIQESLAGDVSRIAATDANDGKLPIHHIPIAPKGFIGRRLYRTGPGLPHTIEHADHQGTGNVPLGGHKWVVVLNVPGIGECPHTAIAEDPEFNDSFPAAFRLEDIPQAFFPDNPEIEALCTRDIYRSDDVIAFAADTDDSHTEHNIGTGFRYVGTIDNNTETEFTDNVAPENMGKSLTAPQDLPYYLVHEFLDNTTQDYDDVTSAFSAGVKLSRIPQPINHTRVRLWFRYDTSTIRPGLTLSANSIALAFSGAEALADEAEWKLVPINQTLQAGNWYLLDFDWPHGEFTMASYGFVLIQRDKNWRDGFNPIFSVGRIEAVNGEYGPFSGNVEIRGGWFQREPLVQSNPNLASNPISIDPKRPHGLMALVLGYRGFFSNQATNPEDDPVGINLPPRTTNDPTHASTPQYFEKIAPYVSLLEWGADPFGRGAEFRLAADNVNYPATVADTPSEYLDKFIKIGNRLSPFLGQENSYTIGGVATESAKEADVALNNAQELVELRAGEQLFYVRGRPPATDQAVLDGRVQLFGPQYPFSVGSLTEATYFDLALYTPTPYLSSVYQTIGVGQWDITTTGTYSGTVDATFTIEIVDSTHFRWKKNSGAFSGSTVVTGNPHALSDGLSITFGHASGYTAGDTGVLTVVVSKLYDWMIGRQLVIDSSDHRYLETTNAANDGPVATQARTFGVLDVFQDVDDRWWLRLGAAFNGTTGEFGEWFYGSNGTRTFLVKGDSNAYYSTECKQTGARPDYMATTNKINLPFQSDQYIGVGVNNFRSYFFGKNEVYYCIQNRNWDDQLGPGRYPPPQLVQGAVGTEAWRTIIQMPDGRLAYWTANQQLGFISAGGFEYFDCKDGGPAANRRYGGWLDTYVDPELAKYAFAQYNSNENWIEIWFIAKDAVTGCPDDGTLYDITVLPTDFFYKLTFDLENGKIFTGDRFNQTSTCLVGADCTGSGEQHSRIACGDQFGYVNQMDMPVNARGIPQTTITYTATGYVSGTRTITVSASTLPTDGVGLTDQYVGLQNPTTYAMEVVRIASNTTSTIVLATIPAVAPASGWTIRLGPIVCTPRSFADNFIDPASVSMVTMDVLDPIDGEESRHFISVYSALRDGINVSDAVIGQSRSFVPSELRQGWGMIPVERSGSSRSIMIQDQWIQGQGSTPTVVNDLSAVYETGESEPGRDYMWQSKRKMPHR